MNVYPPEVPNIPRPLICCAMVFCACWAPHAHAYIDPGTGSLLVQMLIAGAAGAAAVAKLYWHRVKSLFSRDTPDTNDKPADGKDAEPPT